MNDRSFSVIIPAFNEAANIADLVKELFSDPDVDEIIVADDGSTDGTVEILEDLTRIYRGLILSRAPQRSGQLAGWIRAAKLSTRDVVCCIDADSRVARGACGKLADAVSVVTVASGRVVPVEPQRAPRFAAALLNEARRNCVSYAIIGRFFAVDRLWFIENVTRTDILANDAFLACLADTNGKGSAYVPDALVYYHPPQGVGDFYSQRTRADAGYAQLRTLGVLRSSHELSGAHAVRAAVLAAIANPLDAVSWVATQVAGRCKSALKRERTHSSGIWEAQASTKRAFRQ